MHFKRAVQRYGQTPQPETPYQRAGQLWDERIGTARVQAANWRLMAFGTLALATGLAVALVWQSLQSRVVPYVVEVDHLGEARAVTPAEASYQPTDPQIAWFLSRFIKDVRSRSLDPVLMRGDWLQAYDFVSPRGALFLGEYARGNDPFVQAGEKTISVEVTSVVRASDRSFQVKWTETAYDRGSLVGSTRWTAMLSIDLKPRKAPMSCAGTRSGSTSMPSTGAGSLRARRIIPALRPPLPPALSRHRSPLCPPPIRCPTRARPFPSVGEPPMSALSFLTSLLIAAAAATAPVNLPAQKAAPVQTAAPAAPSTGKPGAVPSIKPMAVVPVRAKPRWHRRPHLSPVELSVRAATLEATQNPQPLGFVNAMQVYTWGRA
jgi:type IV secretion system protein VirB5